MKRCPQCNRTYTDDNLSFCLDDGSPLVSASAPSASDSSATVQYPSSRDTSPQPTVAYTGGQAAPPPTPPPSAPPAWSPMPPAQPRKRSAWPWILGIGVVLIVVGLGIVFVIIAVVNMTNTNNNNRVANNSNNANWKVANRNSNSNSNSNGNDNPRSNLTSFTDDFSKEVWSTKPSQWGTSWYQDEEYHMRATKGYYIVMYAPENRPEYTTKNATVRVSALCIDGEPPGPGYGLVVHGSLKEGKFDDYAFLIWNGTEPKYKIVLHKAGEETKLVDWTPTSVLRSGTQPNQLEVRIRDRKLDFYINNQFITSITDSEDYLDGRVGFYTSDTSEIAFDDLEINK